MTYPEVDGWPTKPDNGLKPSNEQYAALLAKLKASPPNKVRLVAAGLTKPEAGNLRNWLNNPKRVGVEARTTSQRSELIRYGLDPDGFKQDHGFIVVAMYSSTTDGDKN